MGVILYNQEFIILMLTFMSSMFFCVTPPPAIARPSCYQLSAPTQRLTLSTGLPCHSRCEMKMEPWNCCGMVHPAI